MYWIDLTLPFRSIFWRKIKWHYNDVIMGAMASQSPASRLFTQPFFRVHIKENIKAPRHWPLCGEFPAQMASNAESVPIWWRHHGSSIRDNWHCTCDVGEGTKFSSPSYKHIAHVIHGMQAKYGGLTDSDMASNIQIYRCFVFPCKFMSVVRSVSM